LTKIILQADNLCYGFPDRSLFTNLNLSLAGGVALVRGGDGVGKTTLLRLIAGELKSDRGELRINQHRLNTQAAEYRAQVFWMDKRSDAFDQISGLDYFALKEKQFPNFDADLTPVLVEHLGLAEHIAKPLYMLSTGSKRKVWFAAAMASRASVILLDDPFAALDRPAMNFVIEVLEDAANQTNSAVIVSHYEALPQIKLTALIDLGD
jgi:ABC-type multidrug transport system ATPase subunit